jgi:hypothetical protein
VTTGNAHGGSATTWGGSEAVIRLSSKLANPTNNADFFTPSNWHNLDLGDVDLGGTSAIPVNTPVTPRILALGKDGHAYLLNRENLGGVGHEIARVQVSGGEIISAMATYPVSDGAMVAFEGPGWGCANHINGNLVMLKVTPSAVANVWCEPFRGFGSPIVTTTDGKSNPIVWVAGTQGDGKLYGFRGTDGKLLVSAAGGSAPIERFQTVLWANGRFYVAANGAIYAFAY